MSELSFNQLDAINRLTKAIAELIGEHLPTSSELSEKTEGELTETFCSSQRFRDEVVSILRDDPEWILSSFAEDKANEQFDERIADAELDSSQIYFDSQFYRETFDHISHRITEIAEEVVDERLSNLKIVRGEE
jgi:Asp-tRNA(Asn)/Glu-tRNA(Gln) amidotransferase A subunit family amidase